MSEDKIKDIKKVVYRKSLDYKTNPLLLLRHDKEKIIWWIEISDLILRAEMIMSRNDLWELRDVIDKELKEFEK
jgi:hypothetical protein